ncbi:hypothetical protein NW768_011309 [Fusarium equiseti]|uniref:Peptidase metallopeptidase domain-containing protein n=1 Tax=Fusarium equiseti TaxID=61235 RepID=A0ABQ8QXW8_FUSEQ|nr:hypothetical protein NW768_011309 [Fusarium equiseti]
MSEVINAGPPTSEAGDSDTGSCFDDSKEHGDNGSYSPVDDFEVAEGEFASYESQDSPRTSSCVDWSVPYSWQQRACKDTVPRMLENKPLAGGRLMSNIGLNCAIGPDKVPTVFANEQNFWNGTPQVICYFFMGGTTRGNKLQHEKVAQAIEEWTWYANVKFMEVSSAKESNVRITFDPKDGSWSYIGRQCDSISTTEATMNLAWLDKFTPITANEKAVILHEFGHALGLLHEHQSPAHGNKAVQDIDAALKLYARTQGWTKIQIYEQTINVYNKSDITNYAQVDGHSIMYYPQPKELTSLDEDIPYNNKLSDLDKAYMILQYPRKNMHPQAEKDGWSIEKALKVIGAPPDVTCKVLDFVKYDRDDFGEISPVNIREVIKNWTRATHGHVEDGGQNPTPFRSARLANIGPSQAQGSDEPAANLPSDTDNKSFIYQLYDKLSTVYSPVGGQYYALQFPSRFMDKEQFAYELEENLSRFNKSAVVNEAEFNDTEALNPTSPIVGGPNGQTLSQNYAKALNGLIPTFESAEVRKQRERMRKWLLAQTKGGDAAYTVDRRPAIPGLSTENDKNPSKISGRAIAAGDPGTGPMADQAAAMLTTKQAIEIAKNSKEDPPRKMTRMEYSEALMQAYLRDRQAWEEEKDKMISDASHLAATDPQAMKDLTKRLAHISALEEAKLSAKYGDAVVRGYSNTTRGFLDHLDIKSVVESLQDAKDPFQTGPDRASDATPDAPPSGTAGHERTVPGYEEGQATTPQGSSTVYPFALAHSGQKQVPEPGHIVDALRKALEVPEPGHIIDALRKALESGDFADWAAQQPEDVRDEILAKVMEEFRRAPDGKQG